MRKDSEPKENNKEEGMKSDEDRQLIRDYLSGDYEPEF